MEPLAQDLGPRPSTASYQPATAASSVTPPRASVVTRPDDPKSGQDSRGGDSQGRSWEQADAKRPLTFQAVLLSSTTLTGLREALDRLTYQDRAASSDTKSVQRKAGKDSQQDSVETVRAGDDLESQEGDRRTLVQARSSGDRNPDQDRGGDGYYGPDWGAMGQLVEAARRAVVNYQQGISLGPDSPYAKRAEVMDLVA